MKSTAETHPDYVNLTKALEQVRIVNQKINESIKYAETIIYIATVHIKTFTKILINTLYREAENRLKLLEIQRSLDSPVWGPSLPNVTFLKSLCAVLCEALFYLAITRKILW